MIDQYTLKELQGCHPFDEITLAWKAGVDQSIVKAMLAGIAVDRREAQKVLTALSAITKKNYTFNNVEVMLLPDAEEGAGVAL